MPGYIKRLNPDAALNVIGAAYRAMTPEQRAEIDRIEMNGDASHYVIRMAANACVRDPFMDIITRDALDSVTREN